MPSGKVWAYLQQFFDNGTPVHLTLIDPDPMKQSSEEAAEIAVLAEKAGTNAIMIGGSSGTALVNETMKAITDAVGIPTIIFPGNVDAVSPYANAIFFMSLLNSSNPYFIIGAQAVSAFTVKRFGLETIPMAYLIVEPGAAAGYIGEAKLLPRNRPEIAATYALAAEFLGMKIVYLEAGSGASDSVSPAMTRTVSDSISIPVMVGGGIETISQAEDLVRAGAKAVVQGTFVEQSIRKDKGKGREKIINAMNTAASRR
ncbi:MAG: geranylgeranylglyceryl/heptaprenylglyceryl phosphate synthase [Candidatus Ranarchaeia archaeon]